MRHAWPAEPYFTSGGTRAQDSGLHQAEPPCAAVHRTRPQGKNCPSVDLQQHKRSAPGTMVGMAPPCATCWNMFCICVKAACTCSWVTPGGSCIVWVAPGEGAGSREGRGGWVSLGTAQRAARGSRTFAHAQSFSLH